MKQTTKQAARGKWDGIIVELIGEHAITRKHGPCPICGGADRYRYDNKRNDGDWFCNVCGVGDGFKLLSESLGIPFAEAARRVDAIVHNVEEKPFRPKVNIERRRRLLNETWALGKDPAFAYNYLVGRGIPSKIVDEVGTDVRGCAMLPLYDGREHIGTFNAMLALIRNHNGDPISIHRTYITPDGKQKKIMPPTEKITGGAVRLGVPTDTLVLAEGIETALAAWHVIGHPAWATISAHGMAEFRILPKCIKRLYICADNDLSFTGQAAAFACAAYHKNRNGIETYVVMPPWDGEDMLDFLKYKGEMTPLHWPYGKAP